MSNISKLHPTHFSREGDQFSWGVFPPGCGPEGYYFDTQFWNKNFSPFIFY